jgi:hypothetical protein
MQIALDLKKLYEDDEHLWLIENAKLLREGHVDLADIEHIAETLEEMGKRDLREIIRRLRVLYSHLLKWIYQKDRRSNSWKGTIVEQRKELKRSFQDSKNLKNYGKENWKEAYKDARDVASAETGLSLSTIPEEPPFTFEESLDEEYLPE